MSADSNAVIKPVRSNRVRLENTLHTYTVFQKVVHQPSSYR